MPAPAPVRRKPAYITAVASFGAKGVCSFLITYWLANSLSAEDLALWATMFSLGTVLGVSELGVGQLILTTFHEKKTAEIDSDRLVSHAVAAMLILSVLMLLLTSVVLSLLHVLNVEWRDLLLAAILLRLVTAPYGAYLSALERYHERKLAEAAAYALSAGFILWGVQAEASLSTLLVGTNVIITVGYLAIVVRAKQLGMPSVEVKAIVPAGIRQVFTDSFPYFVSNVSGLATYGGFIALSALILDSFDLARLSLLHNLVLMHTYQVFELVFRSVQPRMREEALMGKLKALVALSYFGGLTVSVLVGSRLFAHLFSKYQFTSGELAVYTTFIFFEVYYLMLTSEMQMRSSMKKKLQWMSAIKAVGFVAVLMFASVPAKQPSLLLYSVFLVIYSASMAYMVWRIAPHTDASRLQLVDA